MLKNIVIKYRGIILLIIGIVLISIATGLLFYDRIVYIKKEVFSDMEFKKYKENKKQADDTVDESKVTIDTEYLESDDSDNNDNPPGSVNPPSSTNNRDYIGFLEIEKISLKYGLVSKESYYNNVNRNIQILKNSSYPNVEKGNLILAAHSGSSKISYFKNLYKLAINDTANVYYKDYVYTYKIVNIYRVPKTGSLNIYRNMEKTCLTLITCTKNSITEQTVYILELVSEQKSKEVQ